MKYGIMYITVTLAFLQNIFRMPIPHSVEQCQVKVIRMVTFCLLGMRKIDYETWGHPETISMSSQA